MLKNVWVIICKLVITHLRNASRTNEFICHTRVVTFVKFHCDFFHSSVVICSYFSCDFWQFSFDVVKVQLWFLTVQLWFFSQFSCDFFNVQLWCLTAGLRFLSQFSCDFWKFNCDYCHSSVLIFSQFSCDFWELNCDFDSSIVIFSQVSFDFVTTLWNDKTVAWWSKRFKLVKALTWASFHKNLVCFLVEERSGQK